MAEGGLVAGAAGHVAEQEVAGTIDCAIAQHARGVNVVFLECFQTGDLTGIKTGRLAGLD